RLWYAARHSGGRAMYRRIVITVVATGCLFVVLACAGAAWGLRQGLIQAPIGTVQLGNLEVLSFTELNFSPGRPTRAYYTVWVSFQNRSIGPGQAPWSQEWARRLIRLEVPA